MTPFDETPYLNEIKSLDKKIEDGETRPNTDQNKSPATGLGNLPQKDTANQNMGNYYKPLVTPKVNNDPSPTPRNAKLTEIHNKKKAEEQALVMKEQVLAKAKEALITEVMKTHGKGKIIHPEEFNDRLNEVLSKLPKNPTYGQLTDAAIEVASKIKPVNPIQIAEESNLWPIIRGRY